MSTGLQRGTVVWEKPEEWDGCGYEHWWECDDADAGLDEGVEGRGPNKKGQRVKRRRTKNRFICSILSVSSRHFP